MFVVDIKVVVTRKVVAFYGRDPGFVVFEGTMNLHHAVVSEGGKIGRKGESMDLRQWRGGQGTG